MTGMRSRLPPKILPASRFRNLRSLPPVAPSSGAKVYGTINETAEQFVSVPTERGSILLQGWFYLGLAGMLGAMAGWAIAEPGFADGPGAQSHLLGQYRHHSADRHSDVHRVRHFREYGRTVGAQGASARSPGRCHWEFFWALSSTSWRRPSMQIGCGSAYEAGAANRSQPGFWIVRGLAWMVFGAAGGVIYGIVGQSSKKGTYGVHGWSHWSRTRRSYLQSYCAWRLTGAR